MGAEVLDHPEVDKEAAEPDRRVSLRRPDIPVSLGELATFKGEALEIIDARVQILSTLRKAAIKSTSPEDWILFRSPDDQGGQVTGYLQDCGADRVRDLYGIEVYDISRPEKVGGNDPKVFMYLITATGVCKFTKQTVEAIEGGRSSTDDFCKGKEGIELELLVRKAARANLDGNITRELASMKSVPLDELKHAWAGTNKSADNCRRGRGFGSRSERMGGTSTRGGAADVEPPVCPHCNTKGVYRQAKGEPGTREYRAAFYGCPNYAKHQDKKFIVDAAKWEAEQKSKAAAAPPPTAAAQTTPLNSEDVFGNGREPGTEG